MSRLAALVLCALAALVASATPAPESKPWSTGWGKPVDPKGDCRFERKGDRLTIIVPGKGHQHNREEGQLNAPYLVREVEGDFTMEVGVSGDCWYPGEADSCRGAGILVRGDEKDDMLTLELQGRTDTGEAMQWVHVESKYPVGPTSHQARRREHGSTPLRSLYLRLQRRGNNLLTSFSEDRKRWTEVDFSSEITLPRKVKAGVLAEATGEGEFKVVFDHFQLTQPGKK